MEHSRGGVKRALVVDDSKVARNVLARMLEKHGVSVDTSESAEEALDYLLSHQPDVIFLDHIMPGMDGFQAMRAIKQNPRTATIPIMMYTSKEGEVYVGQARALGAVGCLPKQVQPADVAEVLERLEHMQLHSSVALEEEVPTRVTPTLMDGAHADAESARAAALRERVQDALRPAQSEAMQVALRRQLEEQRAHFKQDIEAGIEKAARTLLKQMQDETEPAAVAPQVVTVATSERTRRPIGWYLMLIALLGSTLLFMTLYINAESARERLARDHRQLLDQQASLQSHIDQTRDREGDLSQRYASALAALTTEQARARRERLQWLDLVSWAVSTHNALEYGQGLLDNGTLTQIRELVAHLETLGVTGTVQIRRHHGRFCVSGSGAGGYRLAAPTATLSECTLALPYAVAAGDPASLEQALNNELVARGGRLRIQVSDHGIEQPREAYPHPDTVATAGEWNRIAQRNNRLEILILEEGTRQATLVDEQARLMAPRP